MVPENELKRLIDIYSKLADLSIALKDNEQAIQHYKDALFVAPNDLKIMARLAKIYMQVSVMFYIFCNSQTFSTNSQVKMKNLITLLK